MHVDLSNRTAIVTGAAQGIGAATARRLAASGARVLLADIQKERGLQVTASIVESGGQAEFHFTDVSREEHIRAMVARAIERFGDLHILVNNAHFEVAGSALEVSAADWDRSQAVLLRALFLGAKYAIPHMQAAGGGNIINLSSVLGHHAVRRYVTYTTAKAGVVQLSRQLAVDFGPHGIRVNTITPGAIRSSPSDEGKPPHRDSAVAHMTPLRREGVTEDIANAICFLVSDQAAFITGAELVVDGGLTTLFPEEALRQVREAGG